jgi:uncharacterized protein YecA (UPF0149 family)
MQRSVEGAQRHEAALSENLSPKQIAKVEKQFLARVGSREYAAFWADVRAASSRTQNEISRRSGMIKVGPNELCPCGSKQKFKRCCGGPTRS